MNCRQLSYTRHCCPRPARGCEVLSVFNDHAGFLTTVRMELYREVVPLEYTVSLLGHFAGDGVRQHADTESGKVCCICGV